MLLTKLLRCLKRLIIVLTAFGFLFIIANNYTKSCVSCYTKSRTEDWGNSIRTSNSDRGKIMESSTYNSQLYQNVSDTKLPLILVYTSRLGNEFGWFPRMFDLTFRLDFRKCSHVCQVTNNPADYAQADLVLFEGPRSIKNVTDGKVYFSYFHKSESSWPNHLGNSKQVRLFYSREPPTRTVSGDEFSFAKNYFNYTSTYQIASDIPHPFGNYSVREENISILPNYSKLKSKSVLWMVSNCASKKRLRYAAMLEKYIKVDMYGLCSKTHTDPCNRDKDCVRKLKSKYRFYLAFENSFCEEYITEKFWQSLESSMVPVVMGAPKKFYEQVAPPHSFIHVDDFHTPKQLAEYLKKLESDDYLYNKYHEWRATYTAFTVPWDSPKCDICRLAHEKPPQVVDITKQWNSDAQCIV